MKYISFRTRCIGRSFTAVALLVSAGIAGAQHATYGTNLRAELISFMQVPSVLAGSSGSFQAQIQPNGTITFTLSYANMSSMVTQANIHFGASKTNGGVIAFLCGGSMPACPASGTVTGTITTADVSSLPTSSSDSVIPQGIEPGDLNGLLAAVRSGNSYVNVHTANFPSGEIRGQVHIH